MPLGVRWMRYDNISQVLMQFPYRACVRRRGRLGGGRWLWSPWYDVFGSVRAVFLFFWTLAIPFLFVLFYYYFGSIPWFFLAACLGLDMVFPYLYSKWRE